MPRLSSTCTSARSWAGRSPPICAPTSRWTLWRRRSLRGRPPPTAQRPDRRIQPISPHVTPAKRSISTSYRLGPAVRRQPPDTSPAYLNQAYPPAERTAHLVSRMTLPERRRRWSATCPRRCSWRQVRLEDLPGYGRYLEGSVESLNGAVKTMFSPGCPATPGAPAGQRQAGRPGRAGVAGSRRSSRSCWPGYGGGTADYEMDELDGARRPGVARRPDPALTGAGRGSAAVHAGGRGGVRPIPAGARWRNRFYIGVG